ncbi:MAG: LapA family protein [Pseudomonadota bacterium]
MRILYWVISIPLAILLTIFAVSNRQTVTLSLWPLPYEIDMPLFAPVMLALVAGLGIGLVFEWLVMGKHRRAARRLDTELHRLKRENEKDLPADRDSKEGQAALPRV